MVFYFRISKRYFNSDNCRAHKKKQSCALFTKRDRSGNFIGRKLKTLIHCFINLDAFFVDVCELKLEE